MNPRPPASRAAVATAQNNAAKQLRAEQPPPLARRKPRVGLSNIFFCCLSAVTKSSNCLFSQNKNNNKTKKKNKKKERERRKTVEKRAGLVSSVGSFRRGAQGVSKGKPSGLQARAPSPGWWEPSRAPCAGRERGVAAATMRSQRPTPAPNSGLNIPLKSPFFRPGEAAARGFVWVCLPGAGGGLGYSEVYKAVTFPAGSHS